MGAKTENDKTIQVKSRIQTGRRTNLDGAVGSKEERWSVPKDKKIQAHEGMMKEITAITDVKELKALYYDTAKILEQAQANLSVIQERIEKLEEVK